MGVIPTPEHVQTPLFTEGAIAGLVTVHLSIYHYLLLIHYLTLVMMGGGLILSTFLKNYFYIKN